MGAGPVCPRRAVFRDVPAPLSGREPPRGGHPRAAPPGRGGGARRAVSGAIRQTPRRDDRLAGRAKRVEQGNPRPGPIVRGGRARAARGGAAILPYVENNLHWIKRRAEGRLLRAVERLGDETLYWRIFFKVGNPALWNEALRGLLKKPLSNEAFQFELERRTPPEQRWSCWGVEPDVAVEIYRRDRALFRPFLERFVRQPEAKLFAEAERAQDEEFLDFLSFQLLHRSSWLAYRAFPPRHARSWWKADEKSKEELDEISRLLVGRLDRLYDQSPETYVRHAANILSRFRAFEVWKFRHDRTYNPAFAYLLDRRREAWHHSPEGVRELLESPNIYVQIIGLEILREGGREAAQRALENLLMLRALLLGRARRGTKRLALECLERAARQGAPFAGRILPVLEEAMDLHGKRAIDERIMVSFVRVRREQVTLKA